MSAKAYHWLEGDIGAYDESINLSEEERLKRDERPSLKDELCYRAYDAANNLYINRETLGFALELVPLVGSNDSVQETLAALFCVLPPEAVVQVCLYASPKTGDILDDYVGERIKAGASKLHISMAQSYADFIRAGSHETVIKDAVRPFVLRDYRIFLSVTLPDGDGAEAKIQALKKRFQSSLATAGIGYGYLKPIALIQLLRELTEGKQKADKEIVFHDEMTPLHLQTIAASSHIYSQGGEFRARDHVIRAYYAEDYPRYATQGTFMKLMGGFLKDKGSKINCPFLMNFVFTVPDISMLSVVGQKEHWRKKAEGFARNFVPTCVDAYKDWQYVHERVAEGDKIAEGFFSLILLTNDEDKEEVSSEATTHFRANKWKLKHAGKYALNLLESCFPMQCTKGRISDLKKARIAKDCLASNCASLIPLQGEWKGHYGVEPLLLLLGTSGQVVRYNPYWVMSELGRNGNIVISATSGSGKSVLMQLIQEGVHALGGQVFGFDEGRSHEKFCKLHDGLFVDLADKSQNIVFNPFSTAKDIVEENANGDPLEEANQISFFKNIIIKMAFEDEMPNKSTKGIITEAILETWHKYKLENSVSRIRDYLLARGKTCETSKMMANSLADYCVLKNGRQGPYAKFFNGESTIDLSQNQMIFFELAGLKAHEDLMPVILMSGMHRITQYLEDAPRSIMKLIAVDEAWRHFASPSTAIFFECLARTVRRYRAIFMSCSQSLNDWYKNDMGQGIYENCANRLILQMEPKAITDLEKSKLIEVSDYKLQAIKNLSTVQERFSEVLIEGPQGWSVAKVVLDNLRKAVVSSQPHITDKMKSLINSGKSVHEAAELVKGMLDEHGY